MAFRLIGRYGAALVWLNLLLLMFVAFLPFPTAVIGEHEGSPAAAVLYGAAVVLAGTASAAYRWYASGRGAPLRPGVGRAQIRALRARGLSGAVFFPLTLRERYGNRDESRVDRGRLLLPAALNHRGH